MYLLSTTIFGLIVGSFLSAYTWRWPRDLKVTKGRSMCPKCKNKISLYDNVPLLSFLLLGGRCRSCKKRISLRYPLVETLTALSFSLIYLTFNNRIFPESIILDWKPILGFGTLPFFLVIAASLIAIFVIDFENQLIPDELVFFIFLLSLFVLFFSDFDQIYFFLCSSFVGPLFLLTLHLLTRGKGMGLGDVKLALIGGVFLSFRLLYLWFFLSFVIGAIVGLILLAFKKAKFGKPIPFGPFMILSFFIVLFLGESLVNILLPYL